MTLIKGKKISHTYIMHSVEARIVTIHQLPNSQSILTIVWTLVMICLVLAPMSPYHSRRYRREEEPDL